MKTLDLLKQLEINYKLISNDLEYSSHALDSLLKAAARCDSSFPDLHALPCRIGALRTSIDALATDAAEVIRERNVGEELEVAPGLKDAMLENYTVMVGLYSRLGVAPDPDWVAVADEVKQITPAPESRLESECESGEKSLEGKASPAEASNDCLDYTNHPDACPRKPGREPGRVEENGLQPTPTVISEEGFLAVSASTRGRAKLQDVRKVYAKIREHCEENSGRDRGRSRPGTVSKKELGAAGLKVFGLTGDCTLNTLRTMGLIKVTKNGVTLASATS